MRFCSMTTIKALVPPERLLVLSLEKGFGWEEICIFLERDIPDTPYPRINSMSEFHEAAEMIVAPGVRKATTILASSAMGIIGVVAWYFSDLWLKRS